MEVKEKVNFSGSCHGFKEHSSHRACFCETPHKCVCKTKSKTATPSTIEDILKTLFPEINFDEPEDFATLVEKLVKEWVNQVPPFYNIEIAKDEKEELIKKLSDELKHMEDKNVDEVKRKTLRYLRNTASLRDKRDSIVNDMGENLVNKVRYLVVQNQWQNNISELVTDILFKYELSDHNKALITKAVAQKLKPIVMNRALPNQDFKGFLKDEIFGLIQLLPLDVKDQVSLNKRNKTGIRGTQVKYEPDISKLKDIESKVLEWLTFLSELSNMATSDRKKLVAPLVESLAKQDNPDEMKSFVKDWLNKVVNKDGRLSSKSINKLTRKLISRLQPGDEIDQKKIKIKPSQEEELGRNLKGIVMEWFRGIPEFVSDDTYETKMAVENLANRLNEIIGENKIIDQNASEVHAEVKNWLTRTFKSKNIPPLRVDNIVNSIISEIKKNIQSTRRYKSQLEINILKSEIQRWLSDLPYADLKNTKKYQQLTQMIADDLEDIRKMKLDDKLFEREAIDAIKKWIFKVIKETGIEIRARDRQNIINNLLTLMKDSVNSERSSKNYKQIPQSYANKIALKGRKKWRKMRAPKRDIRDGVSKVLNKYSSNYMNQTKEDLISRITDEIEMKMGSIPIPDATETKVPISHILEDNTQFSANDIDDIASAVVNKVIDFSVPSLFGRRVTDNYKTPNDESRSQGPSESYDDEFDEESDFDGKKRFPMQKHKFIKNIAQDISDNIDKFLGHDDDVQAFGQRGTSTPERESGPSLDTLSIRSIQDRTNYSEENTEIIRIKSTLRDWLHGLNIDDDLKNKIINELAEDILDRQKYLKISNSKTRKSVEIEHLKFQIYKRLNKVISDDELSIYMESIEDLARRLTLFCTCHDYNYENVESLNYKTKLRTVISQSFPSCIHDDSFEVFKHDLADAFVSLHFCTGNQTARNKYKTKIRQEISNFCCNYLKQCPSSRLDTKQLNKELYIALLKVPVPVKELLEPSHRVSLIQEEICSWLDKTQPSILRSMKTRENVSILAQKICTIQDASPSNTEELVNTVTDWLKNLNLNPIRNIDIQTEARMMCCRINNRQGTSDIDKTGSGLKINVTQNIEHSKKSSGTQYTPILPPSTLSAEDRQHLDRIRARNPVREVIYHKEKTIDASCDPPPINISTQTIVTHDSIPASAEKTVNVDISPQVLVKEYHWESTDESKLPPQSINIKIPAINQGNVDVVTHNEFTQAPIDRPNVTQTTNVTQETNPDFHQTLTNSVNAQNESHNRVESFVTESQRVVLTGFPAPYERRIREKFDERSVRDVDGPRRRRPDKEKTYKCCRCGGRMISKCRTRCQLHGNDQRTCSRCYGGICPHPTSLYFRNDF